MRQSRAWFSRVLLLAFVLRALIPAGFMPGLPDGPDGAPALVICTAHGLKLAVAGEAAQPDGGGAAKHAGEPCVFSGTPPLAAADGPAGEPLLTHLVTAAATPARDITLPPVRAGPAVGSRAPPVVL